MAYPIVKKPGVIGGAHAHPDNQEEVLYGQLLKPWDQVKRGDFYASGNREWEVCPNEWAGLDVGDFSSPIVRPYS